MKVALRIEGRKTCPVEFHSRAYVCVCFLSMQRLSFEFTQASYQTKAMKNCIDVGKKIMEKKNVMIM